MIKIRKDTKKYNAFGIKAEWTAGKIIALHTALKVYAPHSPVAQDVLDEVERAIRELNDPTLQI